MNALRSKDFQSVLDSIVPNRSLTFHLYLKTPITVLKTLKQTLVKISGSLIFPIPI